MTTAELAAEFQRLSHLLDEGLKVLREQSAVTAEAERDYRQAKGMSWVHHTLGPVAERQALIDGETAALRYDRDIAEGLRRAAIESIRSRQTQISMLQTLAAAHRAEASISSYGPQDGP